MSAKGRCSELHLALKCSEARTPASSRTSLLPLSLYLLTQTRTTALESPFREQGRGMGREGWGLWGLGWGHRLSSSQDRRSPGDLQAGSPCTPTVGAIKSFGGLAPPNS